MSADYDASFSACSTGHAGTFIISPGHTVHAVPPETGARFVGCSTNRCNRWFFRWDMRYFMILCSGASASACEKITDVSAINQRIAEHHGWPEHGSSAADEKAAMLEQSVVMRVAEQWEAEQRLMREPDT